MTTAIAIHTVFALTAVVVGLTIFCLPKGTPTHKLAGRIWVAAMMVVAAGSFQIRELNPDGGLSWIHGLSAFTIISIIYAIASIRKGRRTAHFSAMIGTFIGLTVAGALTLLPNRIIGGFLFGG